MVSLAPIVLFVYNRPDHARQTLDALSKNVLAEQSVLYVFCDGPKNSASEEEEKKIADTRTIVRSKQWCKEVIIEEEKTNKGLATSIISGVTEVVNKHGKVIVLEDDIITGKGFLKYMNDALDLYENNEQVASIHAYNLPIKTIGLNATFFLRGADCWGWATWQSRWQLFNPDAMTLYNELVNQQLLYKFDLNGSYPYGNMLKDQIAGKINSWAIRWHASAFLANGLTLYPKISLIKNIGLDGSGTHCDSVENHNFSFVDFCDVERIPLKESQTALKHIKNYYQSPHPSAVIKLKNKIKKLIKF